MDSSPCTCSPASVHWFSAIYGCNSLMKVEHPERLSSLAPSSKVILHYQTNFFDNEYEQTTSFSAYVNSELAVNNEQTLTSSPPPGWLSTSPLINPFSHSPSHSNYTQQPQQREQQIAPLTTLSLCTNTFFFLFYRGMALKICFVSTSLLTFQK